MTLPTVPTDTQLKVLEGLNRIKLQTIAFWFMAFWFSVFSIAFLVSAFWLHNTPLAVTSGGIDGVIGWVTKQVFSHLCPTTSPTA